MKILVAVKRVIDPYVKIRVKSDNTGVETQNIKMAMNPFDEIAVEEALRLREKNWATEVVAVSIGGDNSQETLRHALALGVDRAILVRTQDSFESLNIAKILKKISEDEKPDLVLMGKQAIDDDSNQTPQMLASLLNWPQATYASKIEPNGTSLQVTREIDGGLETLSIHLPAIVSTDLRLNEPRYASLPNIMKAKKKPLDIIELENMGLALKKHSEVLKVTAPAIRSAGVKVESVTELLNKLQHEAKVL
ncbi:electron transfer flavoprotein subunit beta/FixA family protein [Legionella longbeachae]|uniref:Electron transfer flavoprotein subunit beta n=1 Tax=Legionella longbeachae serogroup 1 (strain NSW150) TaxID=661367 RepID=D3HQP2_LEGLN|nr:electron transfer flavoprotein subunit beta/FixA family protein [Legionella longbeachae]VEE01728.1 electron transfer flavoprotein beta-subunit (Beta-ETF) [Legionella oakridgensis]ARB91938.1 electron transfer flavoprotein subunit beta/FixA family protein [Legionella longbeachae]ARM34878.1 electron transfer flavoprotein subunit beta/FixA family protein [Legionella longbeachae]EEZ95673.1 electron transfer flavoprotein subunit beta [Legionella longbeachae D-4968]QEY50824.1 electron transfer fla